jgi:hypothetical protein
MNKKLVTLSGLVLGFAPVVALAQAATGGFRACSGSTKPDANTIGYILCKISDLINVVVPILIALGVLYFIWGIITYVIADDEEAKSAGRDRIIYGIIGLAVIISVWGLVKILTNTFGVDTENQNIVYPTVPY